VNAGAPDAQGEMTEQDVVAPEDLGGGDAAVPPTGNACATCTTDAQCGGLHCTPWKSGNYCLGDCASNDDCPTGWMCFQLTTDSPRCIPISFACEATCLTQPCPVGQVCNQDTGVCGSGKPECSPCQQDWDCAEGTKCYQDGKYCAPACGAACPTNSSCQEVNNFPVHLCLSGTPQCCFGENCQNACPAETPYAFNGKCVECLNDGHCEAGFHCVDNGCASDQCQAPTPFLFEGQCVQCLNNSHCTSLGADFVCMPATHKCEKSQGQNEECEYCVDPYPACTKINEVWSCVQCTDDSYCPGEGNFCDLTLFSCGITGGCGNCTTDAQCVAAMGDKVLECDAASGCCYDTAGWCDDVESMCNTGAGSECFGLMEALMGGMGGAIPGMPEGSSFGVCTCAEPQDLMTLFACLVANNCSSKGCFGGAVCVDPSTIPILGDMFGGMVSGGVCVNPNSLLKLFFP
jgi:hypothetical protein